MMPKETLLEYLFLDCKINTLPEQNSSVFKPGQNFLEVVTIPICYFYIDLPFTRIVLPLTNILRKKGVLYRLAEIFFSNEGYWGKKSI